MILGRWVAVVALALASSGAPGAAAGQACDAAGCAPPVVVDTLDHLSAALAARVDSLALGAIAEGRVAGAAVVAWRAGAPLVARGYGWSDVADAEPMSARVRQRMGSITKAFTAALLLDLFEEGTIAPQDTLRGVLDLPATAAGMTLGQLLSHRAGLVRFTLGDAATPAQMVARRPLFEPGTDYSYSNVGYSLLGVVVERVTGDPWESALRRRILAPAGADSIAPCSDPGLAQATGYVWHGADRVPAPAAEAGPGMAAGGLCASAVDLAAFLQRLYHGDVLAPEPFAAMLEPRTRRADGWGYGYGVSFGCEAGWRSANHSGVVTGFAAHYAYYPEDDLLVVVMMNTMFADAESLERAVAVALLPATRPAAATSPVIQAAGACPAAD